MPPPTDEDRQVGPALCHDHSQGGPTQSKLDHGLVPCEDQRCSETSTGVPSMGLISAFKAVLLIVARTMFAKFIGVDVCDIDEQRIARTSLGVEGWACSKDLDEADLAGSTAEVMPRAGYSEVGEIVETMPQRPPRRCLVLGFRRSRYRGRRQAQCPSGKTHRCPWREWCGTPCHPQGRCGPAGDH